MSIIHLNQIKNQINTLFEGKIDLCDVTDPNPENYFLTRALSAYSIHYLAQAELDEAAAAVTDGGNDNGLDAIHYDARERRLYLVQSKWIHSGNGEPENGDVKKFIAGIHDLCNLAIRKVNEEKRQEKKRFSASSGCLFPGARAPR